MKDVIQSLAHVRKVFTLTYKQINLLKEDLRKLEIEIQDILHVFEFGSINAVIRSKLSNELRKLRKERREVKNELEIYEAVMILVSKYKVSKHDIDRTIGDVHNLMKNQEIRSYQMRVRHDLQAFMKDR